MPDLCMAWIGLGQNTVFASKMPSLCSAPWSLSLNSPCGLEIIVVPLLDCEESHWSWQSVTSAMSIWSSGLPGSSRWYHQCHLLKEEGKQAVHKDALMPH